jgi:hypothetical protein
MTKEFLFDVWAPEDARWSRWMKPVLFACMDQPLATWMHGPTTWDASWAPPANENVPLVIDLPGREGVDAALALAERGYRPVPLYNALPLPVPVLNPIAPIAAATAVDVRDIMVAIQQATERLNQLALSAEAPPAFLLDWRRRGSGLQMPPGSFDNRSVSFTTDFPSANYLRAHGIGRVVLVQPGGDVPQADLAHTLRRWQEAGVLVELKRLDMPGAPTPCDVPKPSWFGWIWQRTLIGLGLRRGKIGGFGAWVPEPSSSSG